MANDVTETAQNPPPNPPANNLPPAPGPGGPTAPPAASTVINGTRTEREISLEAELNTEKLTHAQTAKEKKDRELRIAELQDELHRLKSAPRPPLEKKSALEEFFDEE